MRRVTPIWAGLATITAAVVVLGFSATGAIASTGDGPAGPLPYRMFAPYFETYNTTSGSMAALSRASGVKLLSLAFLQTAQSGSCVADWNGDPTEPSAPAIARVFENLITTYNVSRIDLDVEGNSVFNPDGINRRNEAIAETEAWAAAHHRQIQ